jgi:TetR/AcrR family transcriptional regulator
MARPKADDHDDKRRAMLKRSAELFARQGYDRTSMAEIAAACGSSKALLYHYYANKEALLLDILHAHLQDLVDVVAAADDAASPPEARLRAMTGALLEAYRDADGEHKIQIAELSRLPPEQQSELRDMERTLVRRFADVIALARPALSGAEGLVKPVTMSLFGMLNWHYMWFRPDGPLTREAYADLAVRLVLDGTAALAAPAVAPTPPTRRRAPPPPSPLAGDGAPTGRLWG